MIIDKEGLLSALERAMPGLAQKKDFIDSYMNFSFDNNQIITYNESVAISVPIETGLSCSVPAKEFHAMIKKFDSTVIKLELVSNELKIETADGVVASMNVFQDDKIKTATQALIDYVQFKPLPSNFQEAITLCGPSTDMTMLIPWMKTLNIRGNRVLSTDSYRISKYIMDDTIEDDSRPEIHIPYTSIDGAIGVDFKSYYTTKEWIHLKAEDGLVYSARLVDIEEIPNMDRFFDITGDDFVLPEDSAKVIDLVSVMSEESKGKVKWVKIYITSGKALFRCERQGMGWIEKDLPMEYVGLPVSFMLDPTKAEAILKRTRKISLTEKFCIFRHDNFQHILALIDDEKVKQNE